MYFFACKVIHSCLNVKIYSKIMSHADIFFDIT